MSHKKIRLIDKIYFLLFESVPYLLSPKRPLVAFWHCFAIGLLLSWVTVYFYIGIPIPEQTSADKFIDLSIYWFSIIAVPFVLLKLYWSQLNTNKEHEFRERELKLKESQQQKE